MERYEKSVSFRTIYTILIFVIQIAVYYFTEDYHWFIRINIRIFVWSMLFNPFFELIKRRNR
ncbi:hypothetical protein WG909_05380 [Peptostreptococcaceae bacterium AGR-M142]